jgi:hypothetical protein
MIGHAQLVAGAFAWLKTTWRCPVVVAELVTAAMETPDAIGWTTHGRSILVECKTSLADFRADRKKAFRKYARAGVGDWRYFFTEPGLLRDELLADGWGLVEFASGGPRIVIRSHAADCYCREAKFDAQARHASMCSPAFRRKAQDNEALMLMSLCRRLAGPGVRGKTQAFVRAYVNDEKGQPIE